ncbi:Probable diaminopimelate decarboxylase LysA [Mycobacteroides abscessus subsp. bolletii]|uniref:diaminopimelate decarboxylase n=1 Tax=Mycobacteroides abscessus TaxID=36809 RepID=UPI0009A72F55|nr:diaminopimelate decarboxylase [Mycobacteroides abscessus]SKG30461.1 diaminopimelate decarboxylase [Mycobacteroides abscessus subsp. bolletii]SLF34815.1 Probable diaminopimelate decarboxylase LysA [Mycobacteroides abscessus subsp. bolletii]
MTLLDLLPSLHNVARPRVDPAVWPVTTHLDEQGRMCVGETALSEVADQFRTPAYVLDEEDFRHRARRYRSTLREIEVAYAGKALLTADIARWVAQEGLSLDVCSSGELATALAGGFDPERIIMHGNAKTPDELSDAAAVGVGRIVVDSYTEIMFLATRLAKRQRVLVRVTPDIDIHGHAAVTTGVTDQKFGFPLHDGHAIEAARRVLDQPLLNLVGLHCHIGSQVTDCALYGETIRRMIAAMADIRARHGVILGELNIGGGHGVPYRSGDPELDLAELRDFIDDALDAACAAERFPRPRVVVEPGRAISARAGVTLYRVVSVKTQPGGRTFVAVDGGMSDNPRVSLYGAKYSVALANRHPSAPPQLVTVAGRHCESGDEIARDVSLPSDVRPGDVLAVACTGAYHHSMASSYNLVGRPPVVAVRDGRVRELVRRETIADLLSRDRGAR